MAFWSQNGHESDGTSLGSAESFRPHRRHDGSRQAGHETQLLAHGREEVDAVDRGLVRLNLPRESSSTVATRELSTQTRRPGKQRVGRDRPYFYDG